MTAPKISKWPFSKCLAAGLLMAIGAGETLAADEYYDMKDTSIYVDNTDHDLQFFSPVDFSFENRPIKRDCGYSFTYDKLSWAGTGEKTPVGDPNVTYLAQSVFQGGTLPGGGIGQLIPGAPPTPYTLVNSLEHAPPFTTFNWGERYELGMFVENGSWDIGILDGPDFVSDEAYGFGVGANDFAFGSVLIAFNAPASFFVAFPDLLQNDAVNQGVIIAINHEITPEVERFIDDVNGNGIFDNGDTINYYPIWEEVFVHNKTQIDGIELMRSHRLDNRHQMVKDQRDSWEFGYGVRYFRLKDNFAVAGFGGRFGFSQWDTTIDNNIVGPQIKLKWERQHSRLNLAATGRFTFGYNISNWSQESGIGQDLIPSSQNGYYYGEPVTSSHGRSVQDFSPLAELRLDASYQLTTALAARLGFTSTYIDNIYRAGNQVSYTLPNMGFKTDNKTQDIFINGVNFGFDVAY